MNDSDNTKILTFNVTGISSGSQRVLTFPDGSSTVVMNPTLTTYSIGRNDYFEGIQNVSFGFRSASVLTTGGNNTAIGADSLRYCTTGGNNTAVGFRALMNASGSTGNSSVGAFSMFISTGSEVCAFGSNSARLVGDRSCAFGNFSLNNAIEGTNNAFGFASLRNLITGTGNCTFGINAGSSLTSGSNNVLIGSSSGTIPSGSLNRAIIIGSDNSYNQNHSNVILIGSSSNFNNTSDEIRIGAPQGSAGTFLRNFQSGIRGTTTFQPDAVPVLIDSHGQLGTISSSITKKTNVVDMHDTSDILKLRPVTFEWKNNTGSINYGLIAEEVDEIFPALTIRNSQGEIETVAYHLLPVFLLNEMKRLNNEIISLKSLLNN